jgi:hypothetical protein
LILNQLAIDAVPGAIELEMIPIGLLLEDTDKAAASPLRKIGNQSVPEIT